MYTDGQEEWINLDKHIWHILHGDEDRAAAGAGPGASALTAVEGGREGPQPAAGAGPSEQAVAAREAPGQQAVAELSHHTAQQQPQSLRHPQLGKSQSQRQARVSGGGRASQQAKLNFPRLSGPPSSAGSQQQPGPRASHQQQQQQDSAGAGAGAGRSGTVSLQGAGTGGSPRPVHIVLSSLDQHWPRVEAFCRGMPMAAVSKGLR